MGKYSPVFKHNILTQYTPHQRGNGFKSLAIRFNIIGGQSTLKRWYDRWDGTVHSLERTNGSGRTTIMNKIDMNKYISTPIKQKKSKTSINTLFNNTIKHK
jgi:hypothetical protein